VFSPVGVSEIQNRPYLDQYTVSGLTYTGNFYRFKIKAINEVDITISEEESILLAAVPDKPSIEPWQDFSLTNDHQIKINYLSLTND
jgi:hypothetical protein